MSVQNVILFASSTSPACGPVIQFVRQNQMPVGIVRLDTARDRNAAKNGKYFQIQSVPTLLVTYEDGNIQLFAGQEKVIMWLQQITQQQSASSQSQPTVSEEDDDEFYEEPPRQKKKRHSKQKSKRRSNQPQQSSGMYDKRKKNAPVEFEEESSGEEEEIEFVEHDIPPGPPPTDGLRVGARATSKKGSGMLSITQVAKQMERERKATLGYREEDLPKS